MNKHTVACVSFLNSKPLIEPLVGHPEVEVLFEVPSGLLAHIESGRAQAGLLPIVDFQHAQTDLLLTPAGIIGCDGPTLTVCVFSKVPPEKIHTLYGDTDSHTSVILGQVILREVFGAKPVMVPLSQKKEAEPEAILLIGDKVVTAAPDPEKYTYHLDLGEQWKKLTGLAFVFACWMIRADVPPAEAQSLVRLLTQAQKTGEKMTEALLDRYAAQSRWPRDLARRYFTEYLRYEITPRHRQGIAKFYELAAKHGLLNVHRDIKFVDAV